MSRESVIIYMILTLNANLIDSDYVYTRYQYHFGDHYHNRYHRNGGQISLATGHANYQCDSRSYFKNITRFYSDASVFSCNSISTGLDSTELITGFTDNIVIPLNAFNTPYGFVDNNGNETFNVLGIIPFGPCAGDLFFISEFNYVSQGYCSAPTGVTEVCSLQASYVISGKCESTCTVGHNKVKYSPGKMSVDYQRFYRQEDTQDVPYK